MLPLPVDGNLPCTALVGAEQLRTVMVRVAGAEYIVPFVEMLGDLVELMQPTDLCHSATDLVGETVELRWRTAHGVARADGILTLIEGGARWTVGLMGPPQRVDERLYRRVQVRVDVGITSFGSGEPRTSSSQSLNLSLGGAALEIPVGMTIHQGDALVLAIDPSASRILAGACVVADPAQVESVRVRFDWVSTAGQDQLVALINHHELKLAR